MLRKNGFSIEQLRALTRDFHSAGLDASEVAIMEYAAKVALRASAVEEADIAGLRAYGLTDAEILDIALAAAARCFFSNMLGAVGAEPDESYAEIEVALSDVLPIE